MLNSQNKSTNIKTVIVTEILKEVRGLTFLTETNDKKCFT